MSFLVGATEFSPEEVSPAAWWDASELGTIGGRHTVTSNGGAQLDGDNACVFDGVDDYLSIPDSTDWDFDTVTSGFTIAFFLKRNADFAGDFVYNQVLDGNNYVQMQFTSNTNLRWEAYVFGSLWLEDFTLPTIPSGIWKHFAITWDGANFRCFMDGVQQGGDRAYSGSFPDIAAPLNIGRNQFGAGSGYLSGSLARYHVVKGTALWTSDFTAPARSARIDRVSGTALALDFDGLSGSTAIYDRALPSANAADVLFDNSPNGNILFTGAGTPTTGTHTINGLNGIRFVNSPNTFMQAADSPTLNFDAAGGFTAFGVMKHDFAYPAGGADQGIFHKQSGVNPGYRLWVYEPGLVPPSSLIMTFAENEDLGNIDVSDIIGQNSMFAMTRDDAQLLGEIFVNGASRGTRTLTGPVASDNAIPLVVGAELGVDSSDMTLGELIFVPGQVSTNDRQKIEGYLAHKWGLVSELPEDHPYKYRIPTSAQSVETVDWTPEDLGLEDWKDASDTTTLSATDGKVSTAVDKTGKNHDWTKSTDAHRPKTGTRNINGLNVLEFDGLGTGSGGDRMEITNPFDLVGKEVWCVVMVDDASTNNKILGSTSGNGQQVSVEPTTSTMRSWQAANVWSADSNGPALTVGQAHVLGYRLSTTNGKRFVLDGVEDDTGDTYTSGTFIPDSVGYGQFSPTFAGLIGELIITDSDLSTDLRYKMEGYLAHKWGLTAALPATHPYKNAAPKKTKLWTPGDAADADKVGWYDAADGTTVWEDEAGTIQAGASSQVKRWDDKFPGAYHLTQPAGDTPQWGFPGVQINGKNVMDYASTFDQLYKDSIPDIDCTQLAHISIIMGESGDWPAVGALFKTDNTDKLDHRYQSNPTDGQIKTVFTLDGTTTSQSSASNTILRETIPIISSFWYDGEVIVTRANGGSVAEQSDVADGGTFTINKIQVGRESNTPQNYQGELVILKTADLALIQKVEGYLAWKWGVPHTLPATHPYSKKPPMI